jgi:Inorganic pyrophosphatase
MAILSMCSGSWTSLLFPDVRSPVVSSVSLKVEQGGKKDEERNDRIVAVEQAHSWADIKTIDDLGKPFVRELEEFFVNYLRLSGKQIPDPWPEKPEPAGKLVNFCRR